jgi:hypothetical protein
MTYNVTNAATKKTSFEIDARTSSGPGRGTGRHRLAHMNGT